MPGAAAELLRERREERARHPEQHRDRVDEEDPEQRRLAPDEAEARRRSSAGSAARRSGRRHPREQPDRDERGRERREVDRVRAREAERRDQPAGQRRTGDAREVEDDVLDRDRREQLVRRDELGRHRVARGPLEGVCRSRGRLQREEQPTCGSSASAFRSSTTVTAARARSESRQQSAPVDRVRDRPGESGTVSSGTSAAIPSRPTRNVEPVSLADLDRDRDRRDLAADRRDARAEPEPAERPATSAAGAMSTATRSSRPPGRSARAGSSARRSVGSPLRRAVLVRGLRGRLSRRRARRQRSSRSTRPALGSAGAAARRARALVDELRAGRAASPPISSRIVRSVREATIGSATPSTQTRVRAPSPRCSPESGSSA